jgi:hypothetical protein
VLKFKNICGAEVEAIRDERRPVAAGEVIEVPGVLVTSRPAPKDGEPEPGPGPDDAYLVDNQGVERAWPHATWELVVEKAKTAAKPADKES